MAVGDFEREFEVRASERGIRLEPSVRLPWLSGFGHVEPEAASAPPALLRRLADIHATLGGSESKLRGKRRRLLPVDFTLPGQIIVELDEFQHFTSARLRTLDYYNGLEHDLEIPMYRRLCARYMTRADAYRRAKEAPDFPFSGGRTAQRAYLDACRDLLAPAFGYRVIRIPAPSGDVMTAVTTLERVLAE